MMTWTTLTFAFGSTLTSAKMTQLFDNIAAMCNVDSGAPYVMGVRTWKMVTSSTNVMSLGIPSNVTSAYGRCIGGGGGGGCSDGITGGGSGFKSAAVRGGFFAVQSSQITVGLGGAGATFPSDNAQPGGTSSIGAAVSAAGGAKGVYGGGSGNDGGAGQDGWLDYDPNGNAATGTGGTTGINGAAGAGPGAGGGGGRNVSGSGGAGSRGAVFVCWGG